MNCCADAGLPSACQNVVHIMSGIERALGNGFHDHISRLWTEGGMRSSPLHSSVLGFEVDSPEAVVVVAGTSNRVESLIDRHIFKTTEWWLRFQKAGAVKVKCNSFLVCVPPRC